MKKVTYIILLCSLLIVPHINKAQSIDNDGLYYSNFWNSNKGKEMYVYVEKAYIRAAPSQTSKLIDSLALGSKVTLIANAENISSIKGFEAPWHKISYLKNEEIQTGYVWLGLLALDAHRDQDGNQYLHGFDYKAEATDNQQSYYACGVKILAPTGLLIDTYNFHFQYMDQSLSFSKLLPNMGLDGIKNIHRITFSGEACEIPTEFYYVGWTGNKFIKMPHRVQINNAGIYYYIEEIRFPSEHKKEKNIIYKIIEEGETQDSDDIESNFKIRKKEERFLWNGTTFTKLTK